MLICYKNLKIAKNKAKNKNLNVIFGLIVFKLCRIKLYRLFVHLLEKNVIMFNKSGNFYIKMWEILSLMRFLLHKM